MLALADQIITLDELGKGRSEVISHSEDALGIAVDCAKIQQEPLTNDRPIPENRIELNSIPKEATTKHHRASGDLSTYKFYFSSSGWRPTLIFALLQITFGFFYTFPSQYIIIIIG